MAAVSDAAPAAVETSAVPATPALEASKLEQQQQQKEQQPRQQPSHLRRSRPSDLSGSSASSESRIPLRLSATGSQKIPRRESRLGLRGLFFRNKPVDLPLTSCASPTASSSSTGTGLWSRPFHSVRSEIALSKITAPSETGPVPASANKGPAPPASSAVGKKSKPTKLASAVRRKTPSTPRPGRGSLATWDPPPLFQAYPQAIKQAQLPVCKISVEALVRFQGSHRSANVLQTASTESTKDAAADEAANQVAADKDESAVGSSALGKDKVEKDKTVVDKTKRKHRRDQSGSSLRLDWQNKVYILVTSGYLLQYASEGSFDRLPEKILHITKDSAAFASDLIPGRHWVLQVCSVMDADGTAPMSDSRSLFSRLPFRGYERRQAATFLLVFDNAEEMESWITTLRREIEQLGGKKHLSETGTPKVESILARRSTQSSQRTLVVRDPDRFSRLITPQDLYPLSPRSEFSSIVLRDRNSDEMSVTNSVYSHDGRQLESLRHSGNRFSYVSSGQRTMVASDSSSPPSSPNHGSFPSNPVEEQPLPLSEGRKDASQPARRPSARQRSAGQRSADLHSTGTTAAPVSKVRVPINPLNAPIIVDRANTGHVLAAFPLPPSSPAIRNFSVPHLSNRRFSLASSRSTVTESTPARSPPLPAKESTPVAPAPAIPVARRSTRRMPPPSLVLPRSQPKKHQQTPREAPKTASRAKPAGPREISTPGSPDSDSSAPNTAALFSPWTAPNTAALFCPWTAVAKTVPERSKVSRTVSHQNGSRKAATTALPSMGPPRIQTTGHISPRRHSSMMALRTHDATAEHGREQPKHSLQTTGNVRVLQTTSIGLPELSTTEERRTSMLLQPGSTAEPRPATVYRHSGHGVQDGKKGGSLDSGRNRLVENLGPMKPLPTPPTAPMGQRLRSRSTSSRLGGRHSMCQLADGPPPVPPPTCALPPLPPKTEEHDNQAMTFAI